MFFPLQTGAFRGASEGQLRDAVAAAELHPLLCALTLLSGDESLLDPRFRPDTRLAPSGPKPGGGLSPALVAEARELALRCLEGLRSRTDLEAIAPSAAEPFTVTVTPSTTSGLLRTGASSRISRLIAVMASNISGSSSSAASRNTGLNWCTK